MAGTDGTVARVAVLGAGIMGSAMARSLVAAGLTTRVWDWSVSATGPLADAGAEVAASARRAVQGADVVITMLPTAEAVDSVIFDGGVACVLADGCVWAQMGALSGQWHAAVATGHGRQDVSAARLAPGGSQPGTR